MKLKRLDIHGFKSFYHRTTLAFDEGITAVVGPNGCGKSNIVDSLKWVMGEQGARALRGGSMEDVIFNGTGQRGPMGMCEVRLTYINDGSSEVPARWKDVEEIAIERRMERSGGSDYFVNKTRVRLQDVQELLAGTGVGGGRAYAIIEQGQIGRIVSARPEERRILIEEAAGITRYRQRKKLAERKMEETRANLERLADITGEIDQQLKNLRRAAKKAERYKEYRAEARQLSLKAAVFEYRQLESQRDADEQRVMRSVEAEQDAIMRLEAADAQRAADKLAEQSAEAHARALTAQLASAEGDVRLAEGERDLAARESKHAAERLEHAKQERVRAAERIAELEEERVGAHARVDDLEAEQVDEGADLERLDEVLRASQVALAQARSVAEAARRAAADEAQSVVRARTAREAASRRERELRARTSTSQATLEHLEAQREALVHARVEAARRLAEAEEDALEARARREAAEAARLDHERLARAAEDEERGAREQLAGARSRLRSLEELESRREGVAEGPRSVLARGAEAGVVGLVTESLSPPAHLEKAVAAALGDRLQAVVVTDMTRALGAVEHLKLAGRGRGVFVSASEASAELTAAPEGEGILGPLRGLMGATDVAVLLVGDALVVETLEVAARVARSRAWPGTIVTLEGDRLDGGAFVTGGHGGADAAPLSRRREIRELGAVTATLETVATAAGERGRTARAQAQTERVAAESAGREAQDAEVRRAEARKDLARDEAELERVRRSGLELAEQVADLRVEIVDAVEQVEAADRLLASADARTLERQAEIDAANTEASAREAERDAALAALHEARAAKAARTERMAAARDRVVRIDAQLREMRDRTARMASEMESVDEQLGALARRQRDITDRLEALRASAAERASAVHDARSEHEAAIARVDAAELAAQERRRERDRARDVVADARLGLQERLLRLENVAQRVQEVHKVEVGEAARELEGIDPPSPEDKQRLDEIEGLIERMGEVNLGAIEECVEVEKRHEFLVAQQQDLNAALDDLEKAIDQINRTSRQLFRETYEAVNGRFQALFPRLFRGGEAHLALVDPDDLLETGIEMLVQPPGKKVGNVGLLSGGEKAMCAIALIFAVFQVKPSPFCLLDEVDAPLDDANIGRFNEVVREMSRTSQIVLITHNKRTMEIGDVLYGITMEEPGVSKLVSVRMT
jgi:chromosome segregation protein